SDGEIAARVPDKRRRGRRADPGSSLEAMGNKKRGPQGPRLRSWRGFVVCGPWVPDRAARVRDARLHLRRRGVIPVLYQVLFLLLVARRQLEQARGGAAEDVVLALLGEERQVVDRRRQVEIPVRVVRGVEQVVLRIHHAERALHRLAVL